MTYGLRHGSLSGRPAVGHFRTDPNISTFDGNATPGVQDDESAASEPLPEITLLFQLDG
jgi:hypothetical protein